MTSLQMPSADIRARAWVRAISARPAGLVVDKEKVDTNLWNLLSGGKRNAPSQPIQQLPVQPSPRKFKQQLRETRESDPWQTESSSTYVFYVTGDLGMFIYTYTHTHIHINHLTNQNNIYIYNNQ